MVDDPPTERREVGETITARFEIATSAEGLWDQRELEVH